MTAELEDVAERAATKAIEGLFVRLGVDISTPAAVIEVQRDFAHMRFWRKTGVRVLGTIFTAATMAVVGTLAAAFTHK